MSSYQWSPLTGSGGGVAIYPTFAAFPAASSQPAGTLAVAADTGILYESNGVSWTAIAGPGAALSLGPFGSSPNADGASLSSNTLTLQPADGTHPGGVSITSQTFAGSKTFSSLINADGGIDRSTVGTLTIGATNSSTINIGNSGATVNIQGTTIYENTPQLLVADPLITVNHGGGAGSGQNSGIQIEEAASITGYAETSSDRNSWILKAPNTAGIATITPGASGITLAGSITNGTNSGTNTGDVTLTAFGSSPNANGASLSGQALTLQPADNTHPGGVTTGAQTLAGVKTFSSAPNFSSLTPSLPLQLDGSNNIISAIISPSNGGASPVTRVLYVDGNRTDTYTATGASNLPFKTVSAAISQIITNNDNSSHPYNVIIAPFPYVETLTLNSSTLYNITFSNQTSAQTAVQNCSVSALTSTSNNTQLGTLIFNGITFQGAVTLTGDINNTNFGSTQILFSACQFNGGAVNFTNVNNINIYGGQVQGATASTWTNIAFTYVTLPEGFIGGTTLHMVDNPGGNVPSQYAGNYALFSQTKFYGTLTIDAGSEVDLLLAYTGSGSSITNNGTIHSWATMWGNTSATVLNNGSTTRTRGDTFETPPTVNAGATFLYQSTGYNATYVSNAFKATGATSGTVSILPQAAAGTFNFNLPITAGSAGQVLTSQGGGSTAMTWTSPSGLGITALTGDVTATGPGSVPASLVATSNATLTTLSALTSASSLATVGTITSGTWHGTTIDVPHGGTGQTSLTNHGVLVGAGTSGITQLAAAASASLLIGQGTSADPAFEPVTGDISITNLGVTSLVATSNSTLTTLSALTSASNLSTVGTITSGTWHGTTIDVPHGGTGQVSLTNHGVLIGAGTSGITQLAAAASGTLLLGQGATSDPAFEAMSGDINITNLGATSIVATTNSTLATLSGLTSAANLATVGTITTGTWNATTIAVNHGGTGQTSYTDGQLLIGNTSGNTLTKATLTQGTGITITNGNGSITISATGGAGSTGIAAAGTTNITSNQVLDSTFNNKVLLVKSNGGAYTITVPAATANYIFTVKDADFNANNNNITIARNASEMIEGVAASMILSAQGGKWTFMCDGTNWYVVA